MTKLKIYGIINKLEQIRDWFIYIINIKKFSILKGGFSMRKFIFISTVVLGLVFVALPSECMMINGNGDSVGEMSVTGRGILTPQAEKPMEGTGALTLQAADKSEQSNEQLIVEAEPMDWEKERMLEAALVASAEIGEEGNIYKFLSLVGQIYEASKEIESMVWQPIVEVSKRINNREPVDYSELDDQNPGLDIDGQGRVRVVIEGKSDLTPKQIQSLKNSPYDVEIETTHADTAQIRVGIMDIVNLVIDFDLAFVRAPFPINLD